MYKMTEPAQLPLIPEPQVKVSGRKIRSVEQLAVLAKAREKALEIRKQNQQVRQKQMEIIKTEKEIKVAEIETKYNQVLEKKKELNEPRTVLRSEAEQPQQFKEPQKDYQKQTIVHKYRNTIQSDSDDDEMVMVRIPKKKLVKYQKKVEQPVKSEAIPIRKNPLFNV